MHAGIMWGYVFFHFRVLIVKCRAHSEHTVFQQAGFSEQRSCFGWKIFSSLCIRKA